VDTSFSSYLPAHAREEEGPTLTRYNVHIKLFRIVFRREERINKSFENVPKSKQSRDSSVGIVTGYRLDSWGLIPGTIDSSHLYSVKLGSLIHSNSYLLGFQGSFLGGKAVRT
jgi:hypothetical protein